MRKLKNIFISGILSVCMVVTSLPVTLLAHEVETVQEDVQENIHSDEHQDTRCEIVSFTELPDEVKEQVVEVGTPVESLELPDTLTALCRIPNETNAESDSTDSDKESDSGKDDKEPDEGKDEKPEDDSDKEKGDESGDSDNKSGEDSENGDNGKSEDSDKENEETSKGNTDEENGDAAEGGVDEESGETSEVEGNTGVDNVDGAEGTTGEGNADSIQDNKAIEKQETVTVTMRENYAMPDEVVEVKELSYEAEPVVTENEVGTEKETKIYEETVTIDGITWKSMPEYDSETKGVYIFTPVISEGVYTLAEDVKLPEISVTVAEAEMMLEEEELPDVSGSTTPVCGVISSDTTWGRGILSDGELIIKPGVTLTINDRVNLNGTVTIKGGGTILRGNADTYISIDRSTNVTVGNITIDGASILSHNSMLLAWGGNLVLNDGCVIQNCMHEHNGAAISIFDDGTVILANMTIENCHVVEPLLSIYGGGAIYTHPGKTVNMIIENTIIENCSAAYGGAIGSASEGDIIIKSGTFRNNKATRYGGCIAVIHSTLTIYGGNFIENSAGIGGGCISDLSYQGLHSVIDIKGGCYKGNLCTNGGYKGSGAVYGYGNDADLILSSDAHFCGDDAYGTDGIMLDTDKKIWISDTLNYSVTVYVAASEGRVIAEGTDKYTLSLEKDIEKIKFVDIGNSGETYYTILDKANNQIKLSKTEPEYGLYINYISNGAQGQVVDDTKYKAGDTIEVESADELIMEGYKFLEWNTEPDGSGDSYQPGEKIENIEDDITLYAIFKEVKTLSATFYSGGANQTEVESGALEEGDDSVTIKALDLKPMEDWTKLGWNADEDSYTADIAVGDDLEISEDISYYGIYERNVTLSYDANGGNTTPADETGKCLANVHEKITYKADGFEVSGEITADNPRWEFVGWNTKSDGTGDLYSEGDIIKISEDTTLYAAFEMPPYAYFYSGSAGEYELKKTNVVTKKLIAPPLKEKSGWEEIGWDKDNDGYVGSIKQGTTLELADYTDYYGVYKKEVTLSYSTLHNESGSVVVLSSSKQTRRAKVHKEEITYEPASANPDSFEFDVAPDISQDGYEFLGWNTKEDGTGTFYKAEDTDRNKISITQDTILYAIFRIVPLAAFYSGDAGQHKTIKGEFNYSVNATVTAPDLEEMDGWVPVGWSTDETGYSGSIKAGSVISLSENTSYYGIYKKEVELSYDANGWAVDNPENQSGFCYANVHEDITCEPVRVNTIPQISRAGYRFLGWSTSKDVTGLPMPDYYRPGESIDIESDVTLYAHMIDDISPVLEDASYNSGYKSIEDWVVRKKELVITVPITEEGSGVNKIVYTLTPENGEPVTGEALMQEAYVSRQVRQAAVVQLDVVGGKMNVNSQETIAEDQTGTTGGQVGITDGQIQARITISEDYKGTVILKCIDNAGNESADKLLTAAGGGVIVEDNAPQISFVNKSIKSSKAVVNVSVSDDVDTDKNSKITGGIASITYQIDNKEGQNVTTKNFAEEIVPSCEFSVDISGSGEHTLKVTAVDNAGNESQQSTKVIIAARNKKTTVIEQSNSNPPTEEKEEFVPLVKVNKPELPKDSEPATGDNSMRVEVYATIAMIAGLLYVLLYFITGTNGMTEEEKDETVSRILSWAKKGGRCRKLAAIAAIFCVLFYYHSIGKRVNVEWKEVVDSRV